MDFKTTSLALLLFFLIGNFPISAQKYVLKNEQKHQPNTLIVKVKNNSTHAFQADGKMNQNQKVNNTLLSRLGVKKARRLFKEKTLDKIGVRKKLVNISKYNIENIYKLEIAETQNLEQVIAELKKESWILYAEPAYAHKTLFEVDDTFASFQYGHINSQVYDAWDIEKGDTSVIVGVIDTGCRTSHPEFEGQLQYNWAEKNGTIGIDDDLNGFVDDTLGYDFGDWDNDITDPGVHGTEVTSIIASKVNNGFGTVGVGFNTRVLPVRIATYNNGEYLRNEYEGVMYAVENGARIINLSWGRKGFPSQYEQDIINYITDIYDVMVVAAAGNTNAYIDFYPASYHNVLSVSHSDLNDARDVNATYSYFIDLQAFGVRPVASTWYVNQFDEGHQNVTGSSYASPFVAGIGALVAAHYPDLSALQIAELLRISSDNVYDTLGNAPYPEQLGKGRVNALRALLERGDSPALRMKNFAYSGDFGNYLVADDTLEITADFINYLRPSTSNLTVSLSTVSSFATVLTENQTFNLGVMNTFGEKNNTAAPFKLHLHSDIPDNHTIYLRLGFTDDNYTDFQYFAITFQQKTLDIGFARIGLGIGTNGRLGALGTPQNPVGMGFTFDGIQIMGELGLMISQNSNTVSDAVLSTPNNKNNDFKATSPVLVHEVLDTLLSVVSSFNDLAENLNPIGLEIDQKVSGSYIAPHQNYISLEYNIKNVSGNIIDSLNIALFADWDLAGSQNFADWDTLNGFGYIYDEQNNYMGIKISNPNNSYFAFDMTDVGGNNINLTDEFSSLEKHQAMSNRISRTKAGYGIGGGNVAHSVGTTVFNLQTDSTYKVHFTIMGGTSLAELQNTLPNTTIFTSQLEQGETPEFADSVFCKNVSFPISPLGGFAFNFYKDASLDTLLHSGASLLIENPDTITTYYVTNIDKTLESDVATIRLHASQIEADFSFPTTLNLYDSATVHFTDESSNSVAWTWTLGTQTSNLQNPIFSFPDTGIYDISFSVQGIYGCADDSTKQLTVFYKQPLPTFADVILCFNEDYNFSPKEGTFYKFYDKLPLENPIFQGETLSLNNLRKDTTIYFTGLIPNTDGSFGKINIKVNNPITDFSFPTTLNLYDSATVHFTNNSTNAIAWQWNFSNTQTSEEENPVATFSEMGTYVISLVASDDNNCNSTKTQELTVFYQEPFPTFDNVTLCFGSDYNFIPQEGTVYKFYNSLDLTTEIAEGENLQLTNLQKDTTIYFTGLTPNTNGSYGQINIVIAEEQQTTFAQSRTIINILEEREVTFSALEGVAWRWDFGNGTTANSQVVSVTFSQTGTFLISLTVTNTLGCETTIVQNLEVISDAVTGISDNELSQQINLFPNPAKQYFVLQNEAKKTLQTIRIIDVLGREVQRFSRTKTSQKRHQIDISKLSKGLYYVQIQIGKAVVIKKILKE